MRRSPPAFSLLEVMLTLGLMATTLILVFTTLIGGLGMQKRAEMVEQGSSLARRQLESITSVPFAIVAGEFKGREGTPTIAGFPPPPYPSAIQGRELWVDVKVEAKDDRLWYVEITVHSEDELTTSLETFLKR